jgi:nitroreductase
MASRKTWLEGVFTGPWSPVSVRSRVIGDWSIFSHDERMIGVEFAELMHSRYSVRKFISRQVSRDTIQKILELAQRTASWCNTQPWQLVVTSGKATERFRAVLFEYAASGREPNPDFAFPTGYYGKFRERRKVCAVQLYESLGIGKDERAAAARQALENFRFFDAPHVALLTTEEFLGFYGGVDCGLYINSFVLAALNFGVHSIAQAALASYPDLVRDYFKLPTNRKLVCGFSFGYSDSEHPINQYRTERAAVEDVVQWVD